MSNYSEMARDEIMSLVWVVLELGLKLVMVWVALEWGHENSRVAFGVGLSLGHFGVGFSCAELGWVGVS